MFRLRIFQGTTEVRSHSFVDEIHEVTEGAHARDCEYLVGGTIDTSTMTMQDVDRIMAICSTSNLQNF